MTNEETIQQKLIERFPFLKDQVRIARARRLFVHVPADRFAEVFEAAVGEFGFVILCMVTGLDEGENLVALYHLAQESGAIATFKLCLPKDRPVLRTITARFPAAAVMERELVDLLGFQVQGLPEGSRYPLPDDWPAGQYPLRKDWKLEMLGQAEVPRA